MTTANALPASATKAWTLLAVVLAATSVLMWDALTSLIRLGWQDDRYTHVLAIPFLVGLLLVLPRPRLLPATRSHTPYLVVSLSAVVLGRVLDRVYPSRDSENGLILGAAVLVVAWTAALVSCFGPSLLRSSLLPLLMLWGIVPVPSAWMAGAETILQKGSAEVSHWLFQLAGQSVFREGLFFTLPGVVIQVAQECSGIRSAIGLFLSALVAGYLVLRSHTHRAILLLMVIPITIFKNAVRIVGLALLGVHVSMDFLLGPLHRSSGLLFSTLSFALTAALIVLLFLRERNQRSPETSRLLKNPRNKSPRKCS